MNKKTNSLGTEPDLDWDGELQLGSGWGKDLGTGTVSKDREWVTLGLGQGRKACYTARQIRADINRFGDIQLLLIGSRWKFQPSH